MVIFMNNSFHLQLYFISLNNSILQIEYILLELEELAIEYSNFNASISIEREGDDDTIYNRICHTRQPNLQTPYQHLPFRSFRRVRFLMPRITLDAFLMPYLFMQNSALLSFQKENCLFINHEIYKY